MVTVPAAEPVLYSTNQLVVDTNMERMVAVLVELVLIRRVRFTPAELAAAGVNLDVWLVAVRNLELVAD